MSNIPSESEPTIVTHPVASSLIQSIGYDSASETLQITFKSGGTYRYDNVSAQEWEAFRDAESIGKHFYRSIKGKFPYRRVGA